MENKNYNDTVSTFTVPSYVLYLLLPKCVVAHSEVLSTIYFQIALNIDKNQNNHHKFKNTCWMKEKKLSKLTGYSSRKITEAIKTLDELQLIKIKKINGYKTYIVKNNNLEKEEDIWNFVHFVENKILSNLDTEKEKKIRENFKKINLLFKSEIKKLNLQIIFPKKEDLKEQLLLVEKTYKGTSLFFMHLVAENHILSKNKNFNQTTRSVFLGTSQPTLNRYIHSFCEKNILNRFKVYKKFLMELNVDIKVNVKNIRSKVVSNMEGDICCPICNEKFTKFRSLSMHISKSQDEEHQKVLKIKKEKNLDTEQLIEYLKTNKESKEDVAKTEQKTENKKEDLKSKKVFKKPLDTYLSVECPCKITCNECYNEWEKDFKECDFKRKEAFVKEYEIDENKDNKIIEKIKPKTNKKTKKEKNKVVPDNEDGNIEQVVEKSENCKTLLEYFYTLSGGKSMLFVKEAKQIKNALESAEIKIDIEEMKSVLEYMYMCGLTDIKYLTYYIKEYRKNVKYLKEISVEGTAAFLLKKYYDGMKLSINKQNLNKEVEKVQNNIMFHGYEETKIIIEYMLFKKISNIYFIETMRNEALLNKDKILTKDTKVDSFKSNPSFFDQDDFVYVKDSIISGRKKISSIDKKYQDKVKLFAKKVLLEEEFDKKYSSFEWVWKIGLDIDFEIYSHLSKSKDFYKYFNFLLGKIRNENDEKKYKTMKEEYDRWLHLQHKMFEKYEQKI